MRCVVVGCCFLNYEAIKVVAGAVCPSEQMRDRGSEAIGNGGVAVVRFSLCVIVRKEEGGREKRPGASAGGRASLQEKVAITHRRPRECDDTIE
jgi:predicted alpha/beta-hydrolase family hydrolase